MSKIRTGKKLNSSGVFSPQSKIEPHYGQNEFIQRLMTKVQDKPIDSKSSILNKYNDLIKCLDYKPDSSYKTHRDKSEMPTQQPYETSANQEMTTLNSNFFKETSRFELSQANEDRKLENSRSFVARGENMRCRLTQDSFFSNRHKKNISLSYLP